MRRGSRSRRGREGPAPTPCGRAECFDLLLRHCVACKLLRTPEPRRGPASPPSDPPLPQASLPSAPCPPSPSPPIAAGASSLVPRTVLQPQESVGAGAGPEGVLPLHGLLFSAPLLLGLALVLALVGLVSWGWQQRRKQRCPGVASPEAPDTDQDESLDNVIVLSPIALDATAPVWPSPAEDPGTTPPGHNVPVPATELGSTELVTTKTAGPEQQ
ncbi:tumor necrosis factor receptor superfamily member 13C [Tupaia chinensis]|uniref:tumor necrosis factor receptor superfamily member 13C n=1 Tax=Tupaia chinensis TaxID=246437 RepID=UPI000703E16F|nr:tumor necrosis factor receptor superfamily member 13C [Tupaia chinensis]